MTVTAGMIVKNEERCIENGINGSNTHTETTSIKTPSGLHGTNDLIGTIGPTGPTGCTGAQGAKGATGATGHTGAGLSSFGYLYNLATNSTTTILDY